MSVVLLALACTPDDAPPVAPPPEAPTLALEVVAGPGETQVELRVEASAAVPVAVGCEAGDDAHLVESAEPAASHTLRLSGLLPDTTYTCAAVVPDRVDETRVEATWTTGPAPVVSLVPEVADFARVWGGYTLAVWTKACDDLPGSWLVVWDLQGRPRWWWRLPDDVFRGVEVRWHPEDGVFVWGGGTSPEGNVRYVDPWEGEVYAAGIPGLEGFVFHHDGKRLPDGRVLALYDARDRDGELDWLGFGVDLYDPATGEVELRALSQDWADALADARPADPKDPYHANWADLAEGPAGPELWISLCFAWRVLRVDATTGELLSQFGPGLGWSVEDADGTPLSEDELPQCQHGLEVDGDRLLVYDNGRGRRESRGEEWRLDLDRRVATRVWSWTEPGWYLHALGDIDALPGRAGGGSPLEGDHVLLGRFALDCAEGRSQVTEVDRATGEVVGRWWLPEAADNSYRAERLDGCALFSSATACPATARRYAELFAPRTGSGTGAAVR